ncbi:HsdR family type I site-specific deoxyribonuclease [Crocosphaera sp. XPORK-15E]|uniref:type I restriction endonuclease subunit R n=1 Tax=Crocosphaera sp. XPORK-15E TaxID=3110247 RepID=UPI002B21C954|nr:HsdR family type I site-specific deoxyribonuclease [Crocosphaera sp. XPORK-15E]MEA5533712.1 HsdR family type I site-specific deoxyribonuclease [Crocosphaera sp. XPORK-15E]
MVGETERVTQNRVINLFQNKLDYDYLGNWKDRQNNSNIEPDYLRPFLQQQGYDNNLIDKAINELNKTAKDQSLDLYYVNKNVYSLLRYGIKIKPEAGTNTQTVCLIDWENPENNHFAIAEEVTIKGENNKRPDIVIYINGIALGVIELKRGTVSVSQGIRQNLDNQESHFIKPFFTTMQLVMAGNNSQGIRYGTIKTSEKYYLTWKEETEEIELINNTIINLCQGVRNRLDTHLIQLCEKERFLELIYNFIVFDTGIKKVCRHHQYFGIKAAQKRIKNRDGGIIWHTQGSGKSLTMVWLSKWIKEYNPNSRILIITDRDELDKQIEGNFIGVDEEICRTKNGRELIKKLNQTHPNLICSLIHKFGNKKVKKETDYEQDYDDYIQELNNSLPPDFYAKGEFYVFVDECHRTQSGKLHEAMKKILPNALFIGFTGTPLLKKDKKKSIDIFGTYIHTYKFNEAVEDKVILDLRYEARKVEQYITSSTKIDEWFEAKTSQLTETAKNQLKQRWATLQTLLSSQSRLEKIALDIILDFNNKDRLKSGNGNAILVSGDIYQACKYYEIFQQKGFKKCAIITSYKPSPKDIKGETTGEEQLTEKLRKYEIYRQMLGGKDPEKFEEEVKNRFIHEPAQMQLLIVVDKLLTGFDAPSATYLYIDKSMRDHGLFQAICRVNRLDEEDKEYGYIIDYKDLFKSLEKSIKDYTIEAFEDYEPEDIDGLMGDRLQKGQKQLEEAFERIHAISEPVAHPKEIDDYIDYFCGDNSQNYELLQETEQKRHALYQHTASLVRAYANLANDMLSLGYTSQEIDDIKAEVKQYEQIRETIKLASGDYIDLKTYEPAMRHLIDSYIGAEESEKITTFDDLTLIQLIVQRGADAIDFLPPTIRCSPQATAATIENNLRKVITTAYPTNPKYYDQMSQLLEQIIIERQGIIQDYEAYLKQIIELSKQVNQPSHSNRYPNTIDTPAKQALYDNLEQNEALALAIHYTIITTKKDSWRGNTIKERQVKKAIKQHLESEDNINLIFEIIKNQTEY